MDEFKVMIKSVLHDSKVVIERDSGSSSLRRGLRPASLIVDEDNDPTPSNSCGGSRRGLRSGKSSMTPAWSKRKPDIVQYSHLSTPPYILRHVALCVHAFRCGIPLCL
jgi:hypothetical protein